jgi:hypothetical protein
MTYNDSAFTLTFVDDKTAGERQKGKRAIIVSAPNDDAINGGSPAIYAIDEAGDIKNLRTMIAEAEPAMFKDDHKSGKRIRKRQGIIWGTGGEMETDAFESMVWSTVKAWEKGEHMWSFIVVFADYYSRPYNTEELYNTLRRRAYNEEGEDAETLRRQFHAHYAITLEDVFLRSTNTLIPIPYINKAIKRIDNLKVSNPEMSYVRGKFIPIESDEPWEGGAIVGLPKKVVGVEFRAEIQSVESNEDGSSTLYTPPVAMIPVAPDLSWANRYFQGTDPINSSSGHSKFASCIWDAVLDAPFCILDYRVEDIRMVYQQCILMNIYYGRCFHLVEYNIGQTLIEALQTMEMGSQLILNSALPPYLRIQGSKIGISNKPGVRDRIIDEMKTLFMDFRDKMWFEQPFIQLKNFTNEGKRWETENNKIHHDDVLFAMTFSKIACNAFRRMGYTPMSPEQVKTVITDTKKLVRGSDGSLHYQNGTGNVVQDQFSNSIINI